MDIYARLEIPLDSELYVVNIEVADWGDGLLVTCLYRTPLDEQRHFRLCFIHCREVIWRAFPPAASPDATAIRLLDIQLGEEKCRKPAQLLTEHFKVSARYDRMDIEDV
jgi:hypothetical protein